MNIPQNYRTSKTDSLEKPRVLDPSNYRYHYMNAGGWLNLLYFGLCRMEILRPAQPVHMMEFEMDFHLELNHAVG